MNNLFTFLNFAAYQKCVIKIVKKVYLSINFFEKFIKSL